ncbi:MAG: hypothetical protein P8J30_02480 [Ilumatobacter sp.]|nr:hypothetical protein [Ilumatobacter sp.]
MTRGASQTVRHGIYALCVGAGLSLLTAAPEGREGQTTEHPPPETFHWVLPAQYPEVEVTELHPGDCYVIQQVDGMVYFGDPLPDTVELQRALGEPFAHRVESTEAHPECGLVGCLDIERVAEAITARLIESGQARARRLARHQPSPVDGMRGGAYSDVGSSDRPRYRQAPEQRMVHRHLRTASRDNCYEAEVPRSLTVHIRDSGKGADRTGVYSGYLYLEHHHPAPHGVVVQNRLRSLKEGTTS